MKYNQKDNIFYLTSAERTASSATLLANTSYDTAKFYEVDTKLAFVIYSGVWYAL